MANSETLAVTTPTDREIAMTRVFDADRDLVFRAMSEPELLKHWLSGPPDWAVTACENDLRVGGTFRIVWRHVDGTELVLRGVYREVDPPGRVVRTEAFDFGGEPQAGEQVTTTVLAWEGGRTTLTTTVAYPSKEACGAALASGMPRGAGAKYDRLAGLLAAMPTA